MTFIKKNLGLFIVYAIVITAALFFERPVSKPQQDINPSQDYVVVVNSEN